MTARLSVTPFDYNSCPVIDDSPSPIYIKYRKTDKLTIDNNCSVDNQSPIFIRYKKTELSDYNGRPIPEVFTWCRCHIRYHNSKINFNKWKCTCTVRRLYLDAS